MYNSISFYCFFAFLNCNLKNVFSEETIPVRPNFTGKYTSGITNYEVVIPQRVNEDGSLISHVVSHRHSKRSTKELEFIFYKIPIGGKDYLIELTPNRKLISPGAVIEIHKENVRKSANRKSLNESSHNETIDMFRNLDIRKLKNTNCYFSGTVKGENVSKAALSTCFGLFCTVIMFCKKPTQAGFIQISKGFYTIEPVAEHDPLLEDAYPHILYKTDELDNSSVCHTMGELSASLVRKRRESNAGVSLPLYVETLIVMDKTLTSQHPETDCENYILTVFNMADNLFHDASLGLMMSLTVVRIIRMESEKDEMNLRVNRNAEKTLKYFQNWQYEMNPGDDSHPNHHDVAVLVTKVNICNSKSSCGLLGLTTIGKACDPRLSAAVCEDNGLRLGHVIAHEIGHLLGADHDSDNSTSNGTDAYGLKTVMHPDISTTARTWSSSSQAYFKAFLGSGMGNCLLDEPEEHHFNVQDLLPGVMYNADFQCKNLITDRARECDMGSNCESLNCFVPGYACIVTHTPPADGTFCGENMWCHNTKCLVVGERPGAIDGNWGEWSAWSDCSRTCGSGVASSVRNCDKPQPSHGGKNCVGERIRYKICAAMEVNVSFVGKPCETGRPSFRDIQCGEFNDWIYPEDGKLHTWMAYFSHDDNPCILYCVNEEKQVAALKPRVVDGTMCFRGIRDICVGGICKGLPCDLHFESNAVEDACGICHGDGTGCEFSEGTETLSKLTKGITKLVNIPPGTRNIKVEELSPTLAKIIVKDKDTREMYVRGSLGMFTVPGSQAWLGMIKKNQAALNIPGPVSKPLSIWIQRLDNVTVKWSMALPAEQQRKPEFAWDFLRWGPCSAKCGPGTQISKPSCMEGKAGLVEDTFCADLEMPPTKVRQCEVTKCEPRWMVGDWRICEQSNSKKRERKRIVYCIKPVGEGEGESQIVSDSQCPGPKPHESEPCDKRIKRKRNLYINTNFPENSDYPFISGTSEYDFRNKYEHYLRRFAVPQKYSQTFPPNLIFSPHFKHYFHLLENLPNGTRYEAQAQYDVSPDFFKTFSGRQVGVTQIQPAFQKDIRSLRRGSKKSLDWEYGQMHRKHSNYPLAERQWLMQLRHNRAASIAGIRDTEHVLILKQRYKKGYNYISPNLTISADPNERDRSRFANFIRKCSENEMFNDEMSKQKRLRLKNMLNSKYSGREKRNMKHFLLFSKIREEPKSSEAFECNKIQKLINSHDKEIDENIAKLYQKWKNSYRGDQIQKEPTLSNQGNSLKRKRASLIWKKPKSKDGNLKLPKEQIGNGVGSESKNYLNNLFRDNHPRPPTSNKPPETQTALEKPIIKEGLLVIDKDPPENQEMEMLFDGEETEGKRRKFSKLPQLTRNERKILIKGQDVFNLFQEIQDYGDESAFYRLNKQPTEKLDINIKVPESTSKPESTETTTSSTTTAATTKATIKTTEATKASESTKEKQDEPEKQEKPSANKPEGTKETQIDVKSASNKTEVTKERQQEVKSSTNKSDGTKEQKSSTDKQENNKETKKEEDSTKQDGSTEIKTVLETLITEPDSGTTESSEDMCDVDEEILEEESSDKERKKEEKEESKKEKMQKKKEKKERQEKKKKERKKKKEEKKKKKEEKKNQKESKKKTKEKKKKNDKLEDSDLDWVDLVWTGFPRNQEEKFSGDGCDIDDEIEKYLKCTERQKSGEQDTKEEKKEKKERKKEEKRRKKEEKKKRKEEEKEEKRKQKQMKKKMQTEELLNQELKLPDYIWAFLPETQEGRTLFPITQTVKWPACADSGKEEIQKCAQTKLRENQVEKLIDHFDSGKEEIDKFDRRKLVHEKQGEKYPDHSDSGKEENDKYGQRKLLHENQGETLPHHSDSNKEEIDKYDQNKVLHEKEGEKSPDHSDSDKEENDKYGQRKLLHEKQGEKWSSHSDSGKEENDKYGQRKLLHENQGEKLPHHSDSNKEEIDKYDQNKELHEKEGEKSPDHSDSGKEENNKYGQRKLLHEKQGEKWSSHSDSDKEENDKYDQNKVLNEKQGEKSPDHFDSENQETDKHQQRKLLPEKQEEKSSDHFDSSKKESDKCHQKKLLREKQGEKSPDHFDPSKKELYNYEQRKLLREKPGEKFPDHFNSNQDVDRYYLQLLRENQRVNLTIDANADDDITKYLRCTHKGKTKKRRKEQKLIAKGRKTEERKRIEEGRKLKKKIKMKCKQTKTTGLQRRIKLPKTKTSSIAIIDPEQVYVINSGLIQNQKEKLSERTDSGKEENDNCDDLKPPDPKPTEKPEEVLSTNQCVSSDVSKRLRWLEKKCKKERMKQERKLQRQREEEAKSKIEEGKRMKKLLIKKDRETRKKILHTKIKPSKRKHSHVVNSSVKWADLITAAFPMNPEVRLTDHFDVEREETEKSDQSKLLLKNPEESLTLEDITKGPECKPKTKSEKEKERKEKAREEKKEAKKRKEEGKRLKKILKRKQKIAQKKELRILRRKLNRKNHPHMVSSDSDLAYLIRSGSLMNQEENFTGLGCDLDGEIAKYLKSTEDTKEEKKKKKKMEKEGETHFGCDIDERIVKYLKLAEKSKIEKEKEDAADLGCKIHDEIEKYLQCMKEKNKIGVACDIDDNISSYLQCSTKSKKEKKKEEKEQKKRQKQEAKYKKKEEKEVKKEEKIFEKEFKKKRKKDKKEEKKEEQIEEKLRKKKKKKKEKITEDSLLDWKKFPDVQSEKLTADSAKADDNYKKNNPKTKFHDGL